MTPLDLQDMLIDEMRLITKDYLYRNSKGERVPMAVYPQRLPILETDDAEDPVPYVIVRLKDGNDDGERDSENIVQVVIIVGMWDGSDEAQGYKDVLHIIQKIYRRFHIDPSLNDKAQYKGEFHWTTQDDNYYPFSFGACSLKFNIPAIRREDALA